MLEKQSFISHLIQLIKILRNLPKKEIKMNFKYLLPLKIYLFIWCVVINNQKNVINKFDLASSQKKKLYSTTPNGHILPFISN